VVSDRVCAVVVTYNRKDLLLECLEALRKQTRPLEGMLIVDNASTDGTPETLLDSGYIGELPPTGISEPWEHEHEMKNLHDGNPLRVYYVRMPQNTGGAGGFHEGMKRAYEKGYDWIWVMDDDVKSLENTLGSLLEEVAGVGNAIVPIIRSSLSGEHSISNGLPFVGGLFRSEVVKKAGLPKGEFFIYYDDIEFKTRMTRSGINLLQAQTAFVEHTDWAAQPVKCKLLLWKRISRPLYADWKVYYLVRNRIYMLKMNGSFKSAIYVATVGAVKEIIASLLLGLYRRIPLIIKGSIDGLLGRMGRRVTPS